MTQVKVRGGARYGVLWSASLVLVGLGPCDPIQGGTFSSAEPIGARQIMLLGDGDAERVVVRLNRRVVPVVGSWEGYGGDRRLYLELGEALGPGELVVDTPGARFSRTIAERRVSVSLDVSHAISPLIYGIANPPEGPLLTMTGARVARQGGNAASLYNPDGDFINAGSDWFYMNRRASAQDPWSVGDVEAWVGAMHARGVSTLITVPALGWVARDPSSWAFSWAKYGAQSGANPDQPDAGTGLDPAGNPLSGNDPRDFATPFSPDDARRWIAGMATAPDFAAVDNELDICSQTHRAIHPEPMGYDELLGRFIATASAIKDASPKTRVVGPASCCWWYYWNSAAGEGDKAAHGGEDLLPWFLDANARYTKETGERLLDVLDVHVYPEQLDPRAIDPYSQGRRLRWSRALWDPTYWDESWIGGDGSATQTQPDANQPQIIPRFKALIDERFPGTAFAITEWNPGGEEDISGGLAVADALGIFGREDLDLATYFNHPPEGSFAAAAFTLYNGMGFHFGELSLPVSAPDPDRLGVYAALDGGGRLTITVVNKDPVEDLAVAVDGLPRGDAVMRHFGGSIGAQVVTDGAQPVTGTLLVPAFTAASFVISQAYTAMN